MADHLASTPLTAKRIGVARSRSVSSPPSYPRIPRRSSSLSTSVHSINLDDQASSTRTPSLGATSHIEVARKRQHERGYTPATSNIQYSSMDDPFNDSMAPDTPTKFKTLDKKLKRQKSHILTTRWSSGSYTASLPDLLMGTDTSSVEMNPPPEITQSSKGHQPRENSQYICPMDLPVAFLDVEMTMNRSQIGFGAERLQASIHVSGDVTSVPLPESSVLAPLDVIILLDNLPQALTQYNLASSILAKNTTLNLDRIAVGYVDGEATNSFQLLLPLGFHSVDDVRSALNVFANRAQTKDSTPPIREAIQQVSKIFSSCSRTALCHIFFITATRYPGLEVPWVDQAIGFHTITPHAYFPLKHANSQPGWHIPYDIGTRQTKYTGNHFVRRVARVMRHIRCGIRPGELLNVKVLLTSGSGCQIEPTTSMYQIPSLRPGETWRLPIDIAVPKAFPHKYEEELREFPSLVMESIVGINKFLVGWAEDVTQQVLTVHTEYRHSLIPSKGVVRLQNHVTIIRSRHTSRTLEQNWRDTGMSVQPGERFVLDPA
ncbi:hypothetical protein N7532_007913 [Penicillium argentinense]|uniref:Uncharacterized protein n=1 Tax=Penicillium argentinense TaxID=1131581 RepID=A0A9W9EWK5_9EURO|nr:uncharacterized protein N7532_007913 [Penicillium argentinense]KAJ5089229.1 hypothetical protein N7532_007913 [Penicillium argentinense]